MTTSKSTRNKRREKQRIDTVGSILGGARRSMDIIVPEFREKGWVLLERMLKPEVELRLLIGGDPAADLDGSFDVEAMRKLLGRPHTRVGALGYLPNAKILLADHKRALIAGAAWFPAGLEIPIEPGAMVRDRAYLTDLLQMFERSWRQAGRFGL